MTGEQERKIAARISDVRGMEVDEIDAMLQIILTRPAPHHHIQLPTTNGAESCTPPQPTHQAKQAGGGYRDEAADQREKENIGGGELDAVVTTASDEQEEEEEEMDSLSSDEEDASDHCSVASPRVPLSPLTCQSHLPPTPIRPPPPATQPSPARTPSRSAHILMRPKRTPRLPQPSSTQPSRVDKVPYTDREVREFILLYRKYGGGARRFVNILHDPACHWLHSEKRGGRDNVSLKDKWRNLISMSAGKCDVLTAMCVRIEREARQQRLRAGVKEGKMARRPRASKRIAAG